MTTSVAYIDSALVCSNVTASSLPTSSLDALNPIQRISSVEKRRFEEGEDQLRYPSDEFFAREHHESKRRRLSSANDNNLSEDDVMLQTPPTSALLCFEHVCTSTCILSWMQGFAGARCQYPAISPPHRPPPLPTSVGSSASLPIDLTGCSSYSKPEYANPNSLSNARFTTWLNTKFPPHHLPPIEELMSSVTFGSSIETEFPPAFTAGSSASCPVDLTTSSSNFNLEIISGDEVTIYDDNSEVFLIAPPPMPMFVGGNSDEEASYITERG